MRRQFLIITSVAVVSFLIGTMFSVTAMDGRGNPWDKVWTAISELQARVTSLEQYTNNKRWHFVTSFTLSEEQPTSSLFFIQGEKWRIRWETQPQPQVSFEGFIIWDENGYGIEWVEVFRITEITYPDSKGIHYVAQGQGSYYLQFLRYGGNVNFTIESYH